MTNEYTEYLRATVVQSNSEPVRLTGVEYDVMLGVIVVHEGVHHGEVHQVVVVPESINQPINQLTNQFN